MQARATRPKGLTGVSLIFLAQIVELFAGSYSNIATDGSVTAHQGFGTQVGLCEGA